MSNKLSLFFHGVEQLFRCVKSFADLSALDSDYAAAVKAYLEIYNFLYTEYLYWYNGEITTAYRLRLQHKQSPVVFYDNLYALLEEEKKNALVSCKKDDKQRRQKIKNNFDMAVLELESRGKNIIDDIHRTLKDSLMSTMSVIKKYAISYARTETPFVVQLTEKNTIKHSFNFLASEIMNIDEAITSHPSYHKFGTNWHWMKRSAKMWKKRKRKRNMRT